MVLAIKPANSLLSGIQFSVNVCAHMLSCANHLSFSALRHVTVSAPSWLYAPLTWIGTQLIANASAKSLESNATNNNTGTIRIVNASASSHKVVALAMFGMM